MGALSGDVTIYELIRDLVLAGGAVVAFLVGLKQYRQAQVWRRNEFVGAEAKGFLSDPAVRNVFRMLDWTSRPVPFDPLAERSTWPRVTTEMQIAALQPHSLRRGMPQQSESAAQLFNDNEAQIRDSYDVFLDGLERLNAFAESGLFEPLEVGPYLGYWFRRMTGTGGSVEERRCRLALLAYIEYYEFEGVPKLLKPLVGDIAVGGQVWQRLRVADSKLANRLEGACAARKRELLGSADATANESISVREGALGTSTREGAEVQHLASRGTEAM